MRKQPLLTHSRTYSGQPVGTDPRLEPGERETCINFSDANGMAYLNTHCAALIKALLRCAFVDVEELEIYEPEGCVVGLSCRFSIGALSISPPRADPRPSRVVSRKAHALSSDHLQCVATTQVGGEKIAPLDGSFSAPTADRREAGTVVCGVNGEGV